MRGLSAIVYNVSVYPKHTGFNGCDPNAEGDSPMFSIDTQTETPRSLSSFLSHSWGGGGG